MNDDDNAMSNDLTAWVFVVLFTWVATIFINLMMYVNVTTSDVQSFIGFVSIAGATAVTIFTKPGVKIL